MEVQLNELKVNQTFEIEFLNGSRLIAKFSGIKGGRYHFLNKDGQQFSIADNCIEYYRFYKY